MISPFQTTKITVRVRVSGFIAEILDQEVLHHFDVVTQEFCPWVKFGSKFKDVRKSMCWKDDEGRNFIGLGALLALEKISPHFDIEVVNSEEISQYTLYPLQYKTYDILKPRWYQQYALDATRHARGGIVEMPTGCHAAGQGVMLFCGQIVKVEDVKVGDQLMGMRSQPMNVVSLIRGRDNLFDVIPEYGNPWTVNADHILTVKNISTDSVSGGILDISVRAYLKMPVDVRATLKLIKVAVDYPSFVTKRTQLFEPQELAQKLIADESLLDSVEAMAGYIIAKRRDRIKFIKGVVEQLSRVFDKATVEVQLKNSYLLRATRRIAESLGFATLQVGEVLRLIGDQSVLLDETISAVDCSITNTVGFTVRPSAAGFDTFYGFVLDGDRRYLLDDCTVTHNSGKTETQLIVGDAAREQHNVMYVAPSRVTISNLKKRGAKYGIPVLDYRELTDEQLNNPPRTGLIAVTHPVNLYNDVNKGALKNFHQSVRTLISDEGHHLSAVTWQTMLRAFPNLVRSIAFSGTAITDESRQFNDFNTVAPDDAMIMACSGASLYQLQSKDIAEYIDCPNMINIMYNWGRYATQKQLKLDTKQWSTLKKYMVENEERNTLIVRIIKKLELMQRTAMVPVTEKAHGEQLLKLINQPNCAVWFGAGEIRTLTEKLTEDDVFDRVENGTLRFLIVTQHADEGLDLPDISTVILHTGKSMRRQVQRVGRATRIGTDKSIVINIVDADQKILRRQAVERNKTVAEYFGVEPVVLNDLSKIEEALETLAKMGRKPKKPD